MKKSITIILIVAILVIATIGFCGCDDKKSTNNDRFVVIQHNEISPSLFGDEYVLVLYDKETKVMYLFVKNGYGGGLTVLVNADGTPMLYEEE